jgi:AraC family transcriptional regulator of adaptative response / methylphosphotriester-DNA alkyltransferase methyltransferase
MGLDGRRTPLKTTGQISDNDKWQAVIECDKSYDGLFFYGVVTTGVFCRPSCRSKSPLRNNVLFFNGLDDAVKAGFRPCKKCRPDNDENKWHRGEL